MKLIEINEQKYNEFAQSYNNHFMSSVNMGKRATLDNQSVKYLGFYIDEEIIGSISFLISPGFLNKKRYISHMGPLLNYADKKQVETALLLLKQYYDQNDALMGIIAPNKVVREVYPENVVYKENLEIRKTFENNGFFDNDANNNSLAFLKWFFRKDLTVFKNYDDMFASFEPETKRIINNFSGLPIKVEEVFDENIQEVVNILDQTANRKQFLNRTIDYHKSLYEVFKDDKYPGNVKYLKVVLDVKSYRDTIEVEIFDFEEKIAKDKEIGSRRALNRVNQNLDQLNARLKKLEPLNNIKEDSIIISAGVFLEYNDTITYLFGGNDDQYNMFFGAYYLQNYMLKYALDNNYNVYDFYGTRTSHSGHPEEDGIFNFKKGFGGNLVETVGYFEYMPKNLVNNTFKFLKKVKEKLS